MAPKQAKNIGRTKTLKATAIVIAFLLALLLFKETRGDFANGILFFIQDISNIHFIVILAILIGLTYIFGGQAGKDIIIDKKNPVLTSIKYAILIILTIILYAAVIGIRKDTRIPGDDYKSYFMTYFLTPLIRLGSLSIIPLLAIWLWSTNQMKLAGNKETE